MATAADSSRKILQDRHPFLKRLEWLHRERQLASDQRLVLHFHVDGVVATIALPGNIRRLDLFGRATVAFDHENEPSRGRYVSGHLGLESLKDRTENCGSGTKRDSREKLTSR